MKLIVIIIIAFVIWLLQRFAENYQKHQENGPELGKPRKPQPPGGDDAWQEWIPLPPPVNDEKTASPPTTLPHPPFAPAKVPSASTAQGGETTPLKPVGLPPPLLESEVAKAGTKVADEIARDLGASFAAEGKMGTTGDPALAATAQVMKASTGAAFLQAARRARLQRPPGQLRIRLQTRRPGLLRQSLVMSEVLGRPRAFDI